MHESAATMPEPPACANPLEQARQQHTRLRRRMLYGQWLRDLEERLRKAVGSLRKEAWGSPDLSANLFRSTMSMLAVLYDRPPNLKHDVPAGQGAIDAVARTGYWSMMQRVQRDVLGMREMLVEIDVDAMGELHYEPVPPDVVTLEGAVDKPERPVKLWRAVLRKRNTRQGLALVWTYDHYDISDPANPRWQVLDAQFKDISPEFLFDFVDGKLVKAPKGGYVGDAYPWRMGDGTPVLRHVLYHAATTGQLWDTYEAAELVDGSLNIAVKWTFFGHNVRNAAWSQRWIIGAHLPAAQVVGKAEETKRQEIVADPAVVLELVPDEELPAGVSPQVGQWEPPVSPVEFAEAISVYERRVAAFAGISPSDIQRVAGDPRSGYALAVSREGQREAQRRLEPVFRPPDLEIMAKSAAFLNRFQGTKYPEAGYRISYEAVPQSSDERQGQREDMLARINAGLLDLVTAYQLEHPGISREDAKAALVEISEINAQFMGTPRAAVAPPKQIAGPDDSITT